MMSWISISSCIIIGILLLVFSSNASISPPSSFLRQNNVKSAQIRPWMLVPRGGAGSNKALSQDDDEEDEEDDDDEDEEDEEKNGDPHPISAAIPPEPVSLVFATNVGNRIMDTSVEIMVSRSRTIEHVKKMVSRELPGKPPVSTLCILYDGVVLDDDSLVEEIVADNREDMKAQDDDEDNEKDHNDDENPPIKLFLDMIPPVDPKFATTSNFQHLADLTTSQLLDAYTLNTAAMYHNSQLLFQSSSSSLENDEEEDDDDDEEILLPSASDKRILDRLQRQASELRQQLIESSQFQHEAVTEKLSDTVPPSKVRPSSTQRGQRFRPAPTIGSSSGTNFRSQLQRNLNINWLDTMRNVFLFMFFGFFGGRSALSKNILFLGAPLCFILQARPVKLFLKQLFYLCSHPPGILLSLMPAPQQAILSFSETKAFKNLYVKEDEKENETMTKEEEDEEDEDEDEDEEGDDESEDEEEEYDEDEDDEYDEDEDEDEDD